jgi:hypothetical protein
MTSNKERHEVAIATATRLLEQCTKEVQVEWTQAARRLGLSVPVDTHSDESVLDVNPIRFFTSKSAVDPSGQSRRVVSAKSGRERTGKRAAIPFPYKLKET